MASSAPLAGRLHIALDDAFRLVIQRAGRLVKAKDAQVADQHPHDGDALVLAARKCERGRSGGRESHAGTRRRWRRRCQTDTDGAPGAEAPTRLHGAAPRAVRKNYAWQAVQRYSGRDEWAIFATGVPQREQG